ncbi:MAG: type II secretion system protein GspL [Gammaproteobacteria bacterium]|jgi:general secretion pathway protein L|nr:type II secretion system protein GspL [Gammaproteobacteria bacterium]MDP6616434.1 type II secretion system protein GspL [Gammaproteobacteria bacterium]MDP6694975.1 type II secretion system protein GspL [Gammaproteobacteria bacterium]MDP7041879.1 type II secretion system protein GspL [Gammaproteobacteria bacterium]
MAESLVIRLPDASTGPAEWVVVDDSGARVSDPGRGSLNEASVLTENRKVIVLVPATRVLRLSADVPLRSVAKIRQALPFALEEQLAGDVEAQHFACEKRNESGLIPVAVVATELMEQWVDTFAENDIKADAVFAESDGIATVPATISVYVDDDSFIIRDTAGDITVADAASMDVVLDLLLEQQTGELDDEEDDVSIPPVNLLIYCSASAHEQHQEYWERLRMRAENLDIKILAEGALPRMAGEVVMNRGVNLLQGKYARKVELGAHWKRWQPAATLLAAFVLLVLIFQGASYFQLSRQETALDQAASSVLSATFNNIGEVADPWNELTSRLGTASPEAVVSGPGFVEALEALSIAFAETPGIKMQTMSFRGGVVDMQLVAPNVDALDQLRQLVSGPGKFTAEIQSANPKDDAIEGRMQIMASKQ